ncbi:hypothetical protein Pcinc_005154 [Petrolisthes cinctipes]|uniref:HAT C-terminal dimerisation domain-containing protein n=1 Tax=Petrolisthes cinctipes TaxID=88211 RepID=A0AAE1GFX0_PETCI|nr:hypothetical protein Pcinc_005154 [Petrolisthes cinctipes]
MTPKRARPSPVWDFMEKVSPTLVKCLVCNSHCLIPIEFHGSHQNTPPQPTGTTINITDNGHGQQAEQGQVEAPEVGVQPFIQPTLRGVISKREVYKEGGHKKKQLDDLVVKMIVKDLQPLSIVEEEGFRELVTALDSRYTLPSRRELVRTHLPHLYQQERQRLHEELGSASYIALTTDIWTSRQTKGYITITAHYISPEWSLKSCVLETARMKKEHTAENIANYIRRVCEEWDIFHKVCCIVTDNGANIVAAVTKCLQVKHVPCFAHTLNLVVQSAMKNSEEVRHVREKVRAIVTFFHHSVKASDKLAEVQEEKGFHKKKLITDVDTRWNSVYYMLERFEDQYEVITTTLCLLGKHQMCLSSDELDTVKNAVQIQEPFEEATREMSSEKFTTLSKIIPLIRALQDCAVSRKAKKFSLCDELQKQFAKKFTGMEANFHIAAGTLLDPRFKKVSFADIGNSKRIEERLINIMKAAIDDQETQLTSSTAETRQETQTQERKKTLWKVFDEKVERTVKVGQSYSAGLHIDMRRYLEEPLIPRGDPMTWWKDHSPLFPKLAEQAKKFLCIPATSVPSERLFSKAGELVSQRRNCLGDENINTNLFLNKKLGK